MRPIAMVTASVATALAVASLADAGGGPFVKESSGDSQYQQTASTNGAVQTRSRRFKTIEGAAPELLDALPWFQSVTVTVTVVLRSGEGTLRVIDGEGGGLPGEGARMYPHAVPISGRGPHTVQFMLDENSAYVFPVEVQWKRRGNKPLKAATVVTSIEGAVT